MDHGTTVDNMTRLVLGIFVLVCQIELSMQACAECACCLGSFNCDSNKNCNNGCIDGYFGAKCTDECPENCKTCLNGYICTECKPGYYTDKCNFQCGKGCVNNTCSISSGACTCKSSLFIRSKCDACLYSMYGAACNNTCPSNCESCISDTECSWCKNTGYYGSYCQYRCSPGCNRGICNKDTGHCNKGCKSGFSGDKCDTCSPGLYGRYCDLNCTENCLTCLSTTNCSNCKSGFYGEACTNTCPTGCDGNCSFIDGRCFECKPGFYGEYCNHTCRNETLQGFKGPTCAEAIQPDQEGHATGTLIGSILGSFGGIIVGVAALTAFIVWRRRHGYNKQACSHGYENTPRHGDYGPGDNAHESVSPVTYEDLKSRDERLYSQITTSQQISPAADYVNCN